jgi:predicted Zn-dependent protease
MTPFIALAHRRSARAAGAALLGAAALLGGCATQSTTQGGAVGADRKQVLLVSAEQMNQASAKFYGDEMAKARAAGKLNPNPAQTQRVRAIAQRLIAQTPVFRPDARGWAWEVNVIDTDDVNAYCAPGGKIAVYAGLMRQLNLSDDELAAVVGHEMAHALREHSREQASEQALQQLGAELLGAATGIGTQVTGMMGQLMFTLPHSRQHESEADVIGLELAARAGYDPRAALVLWQKMGAAGGAKPPQWLSTHPSDSARAANIQSVLPRVLPLYEQARQRG